MREGRLEIELVSFFLNDCLIDNEIRLHIIMCVYVCTKIVFRYSRVSLELASGSNLVSSHCGSQMPPRRPKCPR